MNKILGVYNALPHDNALGIVTKAFNRLVARILKRVLDATVPNYFLKTQHQFPSGINTETREKQVVISLTSFPARVDDLWIVIECLFRQTYKPDKIILWLAKEQFVGQDLPDRLKEQTKRGLEIKFVDEDLKSHKKYFYAFSQFKNSLIITVDDDVYYHKDTIYELIRGYDTHPNCVIANRAHSINFNTKNEILSYRPWDINKKSKKTSKLYVPTGVGGVLYPPNSYAESIFDKDTFIKLCPRADDMWLKVNTLLAHTSVFITDRFVSEFITVGNTQKEKLVSGNSRGGGNDQQLKAVLNHYNLGNLEKFRKED